MPALQTKGRPRGSPLLCAGKENVETQPKSVPEQSFHHAQVGVVCPTCSRRHFLEVGADDSLLNSPAGKEIRSHLEAWLASRCPDHLGQFAEISRN